MIRGVEGLTNPVSLTDRLTRIRSDKSEVKIVNFISEWVGSNAPDNFKAVEIPTKFEGRPSLLVANSDRPKLLVMSHIDHVPPSSRELWKPYAPFKPTIEDGNLIARGAGDAKSAVAAMLTSIGRFKGRGQDLPPMALLFTSDEENKFAGVDAMSTYFRDIMLEDPNYHPLFVLSTNGNAPKMGEEEISYGCRGLTETDFVVLTDTQHSAIRTKGQPVVVNARKAGNYIYETIEDTFAQLEPTVLGLTTVNPAGGRYGFKDDKGRPSIRYNNTPNIFIDSLEFRTNAGKFRDQPINGETILAYIGELAAEKGATLDMSLDEKGQLKSRVVAERPSWLTPRSEGAWLEKEIRDVTGIKEVPEWTYGEHGYDEIAILMGAMNKGRDRLIPGAIWGIGLAKWFHKIGERVPVERIGTLEQVLVQAYQSSELTTKMHSMSS